MRAVTRVNTEQASKCRRGSRPAIITGKAVVLVEAERLSHKNPTGVVVTARMGEIGWATREVLKGVRWQRTTVIL